MLSSMQLHFKVPNTLSLSPHLSNLSSTSNMRTVMARTSQENSSSKRNFKWMIRKGSGRGGDSGRKQWEEEEEKEFSSFSTSASHPEPATAAVRKKTSAAAVAVSRFRSAMAAAIASSRQSRSGGLRMTGTLYGNRRGHVHLAFQMDTRACPVVLLELATPTSVLVREMSSGLVRIALECERKAGSTKGKEGKKLMEETLWRTYCNGRKCGYAIRHECGPADWKVLKAVEPVSMGAGVLPVDRDEGEGPEGEMMYMRARFERVVGSKDSEAFYMMNPDGNGGTELSIYFLRV